MADNKVAEAYVEIGAKMDKLDKDLKKTEKKVEDSYAKAGKKAANALESPIVAAALKATAAFGGLELGVGAANVAIDALTGDIEGAADAVKRLPAGIGPFATQLETLLGTVTGIRAEIEAWERATKNLDQAQQMRLRNSITALQNEERALMTRLKIEQQIAILGAEGDEVARLTQQFNAQNRVNESKQAALDIQRELGKRMAETSADQTARADEISALDRQIKEQEELVSQREAWLQAKGNVFGVNEARLSSAKEGLAVLENERASLESLQKERNEELAILQKKAEMIRESIPLLDELGKAESKALEDAIARRKKEEEAEKKEQKEDEKRLHQDEVDRAESEVEAITNEAELATADDSFDRERKAADQRLAAREKRAMELQQTDQELAEQFRQQAERIHQAELADIELREREKAQREMDAHRKEQGRIRQERARELAVSFDERERAEEAFRREQERHRQEDMRMQRQIEGTEAITRQAGQARQLRPGDRGFGSTAGTKDFDRPQKVESKTLDEIKALLERQVVAGDAFA